MDFVQKIPHPRYQGRRYAPYYCASFLLHFFLLSSLQTNPPRKVYCNGARTQPLDMMVLISKISRLGMCICPPTTFLLFFCGSSLIKHLVSVMDTLSSPLYTNTTHQSSTMMISIRNQQTSALRRLSRLQRRPSTSPSCWMSMRS